MKAFSLTQPWASLVIEGHKKYETRSWSTKFRGPLAIHASKGFPRWAKLLMGTDEYDGDGFIRDALNRFPEELPMGSILGVVTLVDCHPTQDVRHGNPLSAKEIAFGDWAAGRFAWQLENPIRFQYPVPMKGSLGLWEVPANLIEVASWERA